jgi:hypothetical protein
MYCELHYYTGRIIHCILDIRYQCIITENLNMYMHWKFKYFKVCGHKLHTEVQLK